jgi:DNA-binding beta-propeller fold protein YncE
MRLAMRNKLKKSWWALLLVALFSFLSYEVSVAEIALGSVALNLVADIPLPGHASRFDYQSYDPVSHRLYIAHMGDGTVTVFNTQSQTVVGEIENTDDVHGVLAIPELKKVYASATGRGSVVFIDSENLRIVASMPGGRYPDGLAYVPELHKLYVSDESGEVETVIDTNTDKYVTTIALNGEAGNSQYDPVSRHIFVNVQTQNDLVEIDPNTDRIVARHPLPGADHNHGLLIDSSRRLAFIACEDNAKLLVVDMQTFNVLASYSVGKEPDVLAFDPTLSLLYVASESGTVTVFEIEKNALH